ncbi:hypothetical protein, partial [Streptococcus suis]
SILLKLLKLLRAHARNSSERANAIIKPVKRSGGGVPIFLKAKKHKGAEVMTHEEYIKASEAFFIRYSEHRAKLALAEGKTDPETLIQSLANAETTIANLLRVLNQIGIPYYNNNTLQPNIKKTNKSIRRRRYL